MTLGYVLYHDKTHYKIEIKEVQEGDRLGNEKFTNEVKYLFSGYYSCTDKEKLMNFAINLKHQWIAQAMSELEKYKNVEIKEKTNVVFV